MSAPTEAAPDATAPNGWPWALLRGFREGRTEALSEVYRRHADDVTKQLRHGFAFQAAGRHHRFVGCRSAFELHDALHETFRRAFEPGARERYDGLRPYGPYLRAIARNVVLRGFRAREVQFPEVREDGEATPAALAAVAEDRGHLHARMLPHHGARFRDGAFTGIELDLDELQLLAPDLEVDVEGGALNPL